jgi:hypothetical protein
MSESIHTVYTSLAPYMLILQLGSLEPFEDFGLGGALEHR